jgi:hypothetical protein
VTNCSYLNFEYLISQIFCSPPPLVNIPHVTFLPVVAVVMHLDVLPRLVARIEAKLVVVGGDRARGEVVAPVNDANDEDTIDNSMI